MSKGHSTITKAVGLVLGLCILYSILCNQLPTKDDIGVIVFLFIISLLAFSLEDKK